MSATGVPERKAEAKRRGDDLRSLAACAQSSREAALYEALARIRERDGVALTQHHYNRGEFVDDFIDGLVDGFYTDDAP